MAPVTHPRIAPGEFVALQSEAAWRLAVELMGGEAVVIPPSGGHAASARGELFFALRGWQDRVSDSGLLLQDVFVALPGGHFLAPDIAWWRGGRRPPLPDGALEVVPDLVVEVLSPATRVNDMGAKRELYLAAGVRELWLADPAAAVVTRIAADPPGEETFTSGDLVSGLLDGFAIDLERVFGR